MPNSHRCKLNTYIILREIYNTLVQVRSVCLATLTRQGRYPWSYPVSERLLTFGLLTSYFFWWRFVLVTVAHGCLPNLVGDGTVENSWGENWIPRLFYEEYTILWFDFDLCGLQHQQDAPIWGFHISTLWIFFIYFGSFQNSYIDKTCHNNVDTGWLYAHYAAFKYVTVWSHNIHG